MGNPYKEIFLKSQKVIRFDHQTLVLKFMGLHPSKDACQAFDNGSLIPTGIYASSIHDYDYPTVRNLILQRRLAPFYRG